MIMNKKQSSVVVLVAIIAAALVVTSSMTTAPVAATTTSNTTTTTSASSGIELSSQPVYQDQLRVVSQNNILWKWHTDPAKYYTGYQYHQQW
jgi:hypothetical protein